MPAYFFLNGHAHKRLHVSRPLDKLVAWDYTDQKRVVYSLSQARQNAEKLFRTRDVAVIVGRKKTYLRNLLQRGVIQPSCKIRKIGSDADDQRYWWAWSSDDILNLHDYFLHLHRGRPRLDGNTTPPKTPNRLEVRAMLENEQILYIQTKDGKFVPTWEAEKF